MALKKIKPELKGVLKPGYKREEIEINTDKELKKLLKNRGGKSND